MSFSRQDLLYLKLSLSALVLAVTLAIITAGYSAHYLATLQKAHNDAERELAATRLQLTTARSDLKNLSAYSLEYQMLQTQKLIGIEPRLDWIEGLEKLRQQGLVLDFEYTISPQQTYHPMPAVDTGNFELGRSDMSLQLTLLHEEQLIRFLATLRAQLKGWYMLDECKLARTAEEREDAPLEADCTGGWLTLKSRNLP